MTHCHKSRWVSLSLASLSPHVFLPISWVNIWEGILLIENTVSPLWASSLQNTCGAMSQIMHLWLPMWQKIKCFWSFIPTLSPSMLSTAASVLPSPPAALYTCLCSWLSLQPRLMETRCSVLSICRTQFTILQLSPNVYLIDELLHYMNHL